MDKEKELDILSVESYDEVMTEAAHDLDMLIPPAPIEEYATIAVCNRCHCEQDAKNWKCWNCGSYDLAEKLIDAGRFADMGLGKIWD